ncbi:MAG: D-alanyl-D-alanine dipeptidase [Rhodospirillales bacterium]
MAQMITLRARVCMIAQDVISTRMPKNYLSNAVELAAQLSLKIRIYDAFRPSEAQWVLWRHSPDPNFLADPNIGSPHSRGVAIDVTLLDTRGQELDMGTGFDEFSDLSHHGNPGISAVARRNRMLLLGIMTAAGWDFFKNEWWHYQLFNSKTYQLLSDRTLKVPMMLSKKKQKDASK